MPESQHRSTLTPLSTTQSAKGAVLRLPFSPTEFTGFQNAVGQIVTVGSGTATVTGLLLRCTQIDSKAMDVEIVSTH